METQRGGREREALLEWYTFEGKAMGDLVFSHSLEVTFGMETNKTGALSDLSNSRIRCNE